VNIYDMPLIYTFLLLLVSCASIAQDAADEDIPEPKEPEPEVSLANKTQETKEPRFMADPSQRRAEETVTFLRLLQREGEAVKENNEESDISGLYLPENTGKPQGGILILHDIDQHAHWPDTVAPLREYLPDYGWNTLSMFFGDYLSKPLPEVVKIALQDKLDDEADPSKIIEPISDAPKTVAATNENEEQNPIEKKIPIEDENFNDDGINEGLDKAAEDFEAFPVAAEADKPDTAEENEISQEQAFMDATVEQIEGGLQQLNTLGQFNLVIIAHGLSANWAVRTLQERMTVNTNSGGYSLVLVNAKSSDYPPYALDEELAQLEIPILDLYTSNAPEAMKDITRRRNTVVREQKAQYMQIRLPAIETIYSGRQNMISRRVRGWLKTHAAGKVIELK
jgi:hypothetical protein